MTSVMGRNIRGSLIVLAVLVAPRAAAAQAAVGPEAGVLTGFGDHTTQVGVRLTEHRFIQDIAAPFRSFTVGVTWLLR